MRRRNLFVAGVAAALVVLAVFYVVNGREEERTDVAADAVQIAACREANLPNAYIRLVLERSPGFDAGRLGLPPADEALPILSCAQTVQSSRGPVALSKRQTRRYLRIIVRRCLPRVDHGRVVGAERLPGASADDERRCRNFGPF